MYEFVNGPCRTTPKVTIKMSSFWPNVKDREKIFFLKLLLLCHRMFSLTYSHPIKTPRDLKKGQIFDPMLKIGKKFFFLKLLLLCHRMFSLTYSHPIKTPRDLKKGQNFDPMLKIGKIFFSSILLLLHHGFCYMTPQKRSNFWPNVKDREKFFFFDIASSSSRLLVYDTPIVSNSPNLFQIAPNGLI